MNLFLSKLPKKEEINTNYLTNLYTNKNSGRGISFKSHLSKNNMNFSKKVNLSETLERKFQFNFVVKTFNILMKNRKRNTNSVEHKINSNKLVLPIIKEFNLTKRSDNINNHNNIDNNNNLKDEEYKYNTYIYKKDNISSSNSNMINLKNIPFYDISENNNDELNDIFSKSKNILEKSNSTISQSIINNKSNISSKIMSDNEKEKIIFRNLSHGSIFEAYKKQYLSSVQEYKTRNKMAKNVFKEQLEKIKNEKIQKSKKEELFKEYELKFNPEKFKEKLKNEFHFFQNEDKIRKKSIDEEALHRKKIFKGIKCNEDKDNKNSSYFYEMKINTLKPSQRIIQNMLRREKKIENYEKSLIDFNE